MTHSNVAQLRHDHEIIDLLALRLDRALAKDAPPRTLAGNLSLLVEAVRTHLETEDSIIYDMALRARSDASEAQVREARALFDTLKANWQDYLCAWSEEAIAADRAGFESATRVMLPRLRDRVAYEDELLLAMSRSGDFAPAPPVE